MNEEAAAAGGDPQQGWKPNAEFLQTLMSMGIERAAAETVISLAFFSWSKKLNDFPAFVL
jgi:Peptidyl-tRNA hydrolase PTH2